MSLYVCVVVVFLFDFLVVNFFFFLEIVGLYIVKVNVLIKLFCGGFNF